MAKKATNPQNLKPIKKGEVRNPKGRIKGSKNMTTILREILEMKVDYQDPTWKNKQKVTKKYVMIAKIIELAMKGDIRAYENIIDRLEGKPVQQIDQNTVVNGGLPLGVNFITENGSKVDNKSKADEEANTST